MWAVLFSDLRPNLTRLPGQITSVQSGADDFISTRDCGCTNPSLVACIAASVTMISRENIGRDDDSCDPEATELR